MTYLVTNRRREEEAHPSGFELHSYIASHFSLHLPSAGRAERLARLQLDRMSGFVPGQPADTILIVALVTALGGLLLLVTGRSARDATSDDDYLAG